MPWHDFIILYSLFALHVRPRASLQASKSRRQTTVRDDVGSEAGDDVGCRDVALDDGTGNGYGKNRYCRSHSHSGVGFLSTTPNTTDIPVTVDKPRLSLTRTPRSPPTLTEPSATSATSARRKARRARTRHHTPFPILSLPLDVLYQLIVFLPPSAVVSLALTCRGLYSSLPLPSPITSIPQKDNSQKDTRRGNDSRPPTDKCTKRAIRFAYEEALLSRSLTAHNISRDSNIISNESGSNNGSSVTTTTKSTSATTTQARQKQQRSRQQEQQRMRCALCKTLYPCSLFIASSSSSSHPYRFFPDSSSDSDVDSRPYNSSPDDKDGEDDSDSDGDGENDVAIGVESIPGSLNIRNRVCKWHDGRFRRVVVAQPSSSQPSSSQPSWSSSSPSSSSSSSSSLSSSSSSSLKQNSQSEESSDRGILDGIVDGRRVGECTARGKSDGDGGRKDEKEKEKQKEKEKVKEKVKEKEKESLGEYWSLEKACMHCGVVLAWRQQQQQRESSEVGSRCDCDEACLTCWTREVWCHTRVNNTPSVAIQLEEEAHAD